MAASEDKRSIIAEDLPRLAEYLSGIKTKAENLEEHFDRILKDVENGELTTDSGISLLDIKYNYLLDYMINLMVITRMKIQGQATEKCPARWRLIENRIVLEKAVPIERKIKYEIDKMLQETSDNDSENPLSLKPDIDNLDTKEHSENETEETTAEKYVPPRIAAMHYEFEQDEDHIRKNQAKERALKKSSIIRELVQEASEEPIEISQVSMGRKRVIKDREERTKYEEANLTRINLSKRQKNIERESLRRSELDTITKFGDISALEGRVFHEKAKKRTLGSKYKAGKKWKRFKK